MGTDRARRRRLAQRLAGVDDALPLLSRRPAAEPEGPGYTFRRIDYRLEYDSAWRDIAPPGDVGAATHGAYRAHQVFDYLGPGTPAQATVPQAFMRLASVAAVPVAGTLGWLLVVVAARLRRGPPIDRTSR